MLTWEGNNYMWEFFYSYAPIQAMAVTTSLYWIIMVTFIAPQELLYLVFLFHGLNS